MATRTAPESCPDSVVLEGFALNPGDMADVAAHVQDCAACRGRVEMLKQDNSLLRDFLSATTSRRSESGPPVLDIPGYALLRELHRGGQGVVYLARQESTKRDVAIKVMREGPLAGLAERSRFEREVAALVQLHHPNIATIHDSGRVLGWNYFVMDYVRGAALDEHVQQYAHRHAGRRGTLELFATICEAVNAAHLRGIIHRDLKPGNILVGEDDRPYILDFGLAKSEADQSASMTRAGQFVGSLPWASPEQADGTAGRIDIRSDVYALGVIAYQLLTGAFPYDVTGSVAAVAERIRTVDPAPLRGRLHGIDADLETIVLKCLSKSPDRRYQSAGELARDLRRYLADEPIEARRDSTWYILSKHLKRHRVPLSAGAMALIALIVFTITLSFAYRRVQTAEHDSHHKSVELAEMLRESNIERGRLLGVQGNVPLAEDLLWHELLTTSVGTMGVESTDAAFWALAELYARHPCILTGPADDVVDPSPPLMIDSVRNRFDEYDISSDGRECAVGLRSGEVVILEQVDGAFSRETARFPVARGKIRYLAWMNHGTSLVSLGRDGRLAVWDRSDQGDPMLRWERNDVIGDGLVTADPGDRLIAVQDFVNQAILFLDARTGATLGASEQADLLIGGECAFDDSASHFAFAPANNTGVRVYDAPSGQVLATLRGHRAPINTLAFSPDGQQLISTADDGTRKTWDLPDSRRAYVRVTRALPAEKSAQVTNAADDDTMIGSGTVMAAVFDSRSDEICFADDAGWAWMTDTSGAQLMDGFRADDVAVSGLAFSPDGAWLVTGGYSGKLRLWDRATLQVRRELASPTGRAFIHASFAPSGETLAAACEDHCVYVWDIATGDHRCLSGHSASVSVAEYSNDGRWLASADRDGKLIVRDANILDIHFQAEALGILRILAFSADGQVLATGGDDQLIRLWDPATGQLLQTISGHQQAIYALAFRPHSNILAAGDAGGAIILWDTARGTRLMQLDRHAGSIFSLAFAPDGCRLVSASGDRTAVVHDICYLNQYVAGNVEAALMTGGNDVPSERLDAVRRWSSRVMH